MREDGSVTLWLLGLCVVLLFVGGLSLDLWRAFTERRALAGVVDAAAAAGASALDEPGFRTTDAVRLDPGMAEQRAWAALRTAPAADLVSSAAVDAVPGALTVTASGSVELTLLRTLLPRAGPLRITVTARAEPRGGN